MTFNYSARKALVCFVAAAACGAACVQAKDASPAVKVQEGGLDAAIQARYSAVEKMVNSGAPSADVGRALYWPNVIVTGQGAEKVSHGLDQLQPVLAAVLKDLGTHCKFIVKDPQAQSGGLTAVFSQLTCKAAVAGQPDINLRLLYVWERRGNDWKVVREMYSEGAMN